VGPATDVRLAPAAVAAWAVAMVVVGLPAPAVVAAGGVAAACAGGVLAGGVLARRRRAWAGSAASALRATPRVLGQVILVLVTVAGVALPAAAQVAVRESGLLASLADARATVRIVAIVRSDPARVATRSIWAGGAGAVRLELAVEHVSGRGRAGGAAARVRVLAGASWDRVAFGQRIEATGRLQRAEAGEEVVAVLTARGGPRLVGEPGPVDAEVGRVRSALLAATDRLDPDARGLLPGLVVGDTSRLPPALGDAMRAAGLTHVTAVSGAHFAIVGAAVLGLTAVLGLPRRLRIVVVAAALVALVLLVRPEPSVLRAAVTGAIGVAGMCLGRPSRAMPALCAAVVGLLIADPWLARSFGFALSVLATAGIVLLTGPLARRLGRIMPDRAGRAIAVPLAAQAVCAPVIVLLTPALTTYAVPANLAVAPALVPATVLGVLTALVAPWWPAGAAALAVPAGWAAWWIARVARVAAALPWAQVAWPGGVGGAVLLALATAAAGCAALRRGRRPPG